MVQMKNRVSGLLMETGVSYNKQRLHKVGYFAELMSTTRSSAFERYAPRVTIFGLLTGTVKILTNRHPNPLPFLLSVT